MARVKTAWLYLFIGVAALATGWLWQSAPAAQAVDANFTTLQGRSLSLQTLRGKPVILTFWASDCPSCLEEIAHWQALHRQFAAQGLSIIAVAMPYDPPNRVLELSRQQNLAYDIALDPQGEISGAFGVQVTPNSFLIDPQGKIADQRIGVFDIAAWQQQIQNWLAH
jgi:peroxiredoxin